MTTTARRKTLAKRPEPVHAIRIRIRLYLRQSTKVTQQVESVATQRAECKRPIHNLLRAAERSRLLVPEGLNGIEIGGAKGGKHAAANADQGQNRSRNQ